MAVDRATIIANINGEEGDRCYIAAGRSEGRGMLFYKCRIRLATEEELVNQSVSPKDGLSGKAGLTSVSTAVYLARPWRYWGETVWAYTTWGKGILNPEGWSTGLVKNKEGYNPENPCPNSYEYKSQDGSKGRPEWVHVLQRPVLPDGTKLNPKTWLR